MGGEDGGERHHCGGGGWGGVVGRVRVGEGRAERRAAWMRMLSKASTVDCATPYRHPYMPVTESRTLSLPLTDISLSLTLSLPLTDVSCLSVLHRLYAVVPVLLPRLGLPLAPPDLECGAVCDGASGG